MSELHPTRSAAPAVSVVIPTRDRAARLRALLAALARQTLPPSRFEVIIVDDGSTDGTRELLAAAAEGSTFALHAIDGPAAGPAAARNTGWRRAGAPLVAFTDDDCEPDPGWLVAGIEAAAAAPGDIVQGRTRPIPREASSLGPFSRTKSIDGPGPWFQTCNMLYPREMLEAVGGFDERFTRPFGEDADLAWRALEAGAEARFEPRAIVHHAVEELGPGEYVRAAFRDPDEALVFKRHPRLRREVRRLGVFKSDQHALLALAALAVVCARRRPEAASLAAPYLLHVLARARTGLTTPRSTALLAAHDALELVQAARGAIRHRVALL